MANLDISSATFNADNSSLTLVFKQAGTTNPMYLAKDASGAQLDGTQFQDLGGCGGELVGGQNSLPEPL